MKKTGTAPALPIMLALSAPALAQAPDSVPLIAPPPPQAPLHSERSWLPEYPARARMEGREGTTYVRLTATAAGTVRDCVITRSSGHEDLDAAACRVAMQRARIPVEPEDGRPRYYMQPVEWKLDKPSEPPPDIPPQ